MKNKTKIRKKYTPNKIFQLIGFNPNIKEFKTEKPCPKNVANIINQPKCEYNNITNNFKKIEIEYNSIKKLNSNKNIYNSVFIKTIIPKI